MAAPMTFDDIMMLRAKHLASRGQKPDQKGPGLKGAMQRRLASKKEGGNAKNEPPPDLEAQQMQAPPTAPIPPRGFAGAPPVGGVGGPQNGEEPNPQAFHRKLPPDIAAMARRYGRM